jgi:ankyrin repeat protein
MSAMGGKSLLMAAWKGQVKLCESIIQAGLAEVSVRDPSQKTALHYSAQRGHTVTCSKLVQLGALVDAEDNHNCTPLYFASSMGHCSTVRLLLDSGANAGQQNVDGITPLLVACHEGRLDCVKVLLSGSNFDASKLAAVDVDTKHGYDTASLPSDDESVDKGEGGSDSTGKTCNVANGQTDNSASKQSMDEALTISCQAGHHDLVLLLLNSTADVNNLSPGGHTPLFVCAQRDRPSCAKVLLTFGAAVDLCNDCGVSPLYMASQKGHVDMASILINHDANVNRQTNYGHTPLWTACQVLGSRFIIIVL